MTQSYFITTTIPYVNSKPHIGHAQEFVLADALSRFYKQKGHQVILQSGTDDNAFKNVLSARNNHVLPKDFIDQNSKLFKKLLAELSVENDLFVRTSSSEHAESVQYFLSHLKSEDIFESTYEGLYCQGCEEFYFEQDLLGGFCPDHKTRSQKLSEKNIFFKLSKYQTQIVELIQSNKLKITPESKKKEILNFIESGLSDISLSRSAARTEGWGVPYPNHPDQVVYVWIDALINYLSGLGYGRNSKWSEIWNKNTNKIHVIGKNVWKFHAVYWVALLLSAGLSLPNEIIIHGFLTSEGVKISKSLGNGIDPIGLIKSYGSDALRFYLLNSLSVFEDCDFREENLIKVYNSELANKFGNLVSRLFALKNKVPELKLHLSDSLTETHHLNIFSCTTEAFQIVEALNQQINEIKPWGLSVNKDRNQFIGYLNNWFARLEQININLRPIIPVGCQQLNKYLSKFEQINVKPLYPRI